MPDDRLVQWINEEAEKLRQAGWEPGSPRETDILKRWRLVRPKMCRDLGAALLEKLAFVLDDRRLQAKKAYITAGWPPCDAETEATKEWLLLAPEDDRENAVLAEAYTPWPIPSE